MKRFGIIYITAILLLQLTGKDVLAQSPSQVSATGQVIAEIVPVFSASEASPLNFGRFSPGPQGGKIILTPQGTLSLLGSVFKAPGPVNAGSFLVSGDADAAYSIRLPSAPVVLKNILGSKTMVIENWMSIPGEGLGTGMLHNGYQIVNVGATLNVGTIEDNPVGVYTGSYSITFDFY
jgi:hypothetical protein